MPDPIWLDNNIVDRAVKGDVDIRAKLAAYRSQGRPLLITPWVRTELLDGGKVKPNPDGTYPIPSTTGKGMQPAQRVLTEAELTKLGITVDTAGDRIPHDVRQKYFDTKPTGGGISNADRTVLTEVKASAEARGVKNPQIMTAEINNKAMAANTKAWGIDSVVHVEPFKPPPPVAPVKPPSGGSSGGSGGGSSGGSSGGGAGGSTGGGAAGGSPPAGGAPTGGGAGAKSGGAAKPGAASVESVKAEQAKSRSVAPKPPNIRIDDYPAERKGPVTRFFQDRPVLKQAGLFAGNLAAGQLKGKALEKVTEHYVKAVAKGADEFRASFPSTASLAQSADLDRLQKEAVKALTSVVSTSTRPPDLTPFGADRVAAARALAAWFRQNGDKTSAARAYDKAAQAYVDKLADVTARIAKLREPLQAIADDIDKRAAILLKAGADFDELFWKFVPIAAVSHITYYEWFDVHTVAGVFQSIGSAVANLSGEVKGRMAEYDAALAKLYDELQIVSDLLARFAPG